MLNKKERSSLVKKAVAGKDIGKKGKGFEKIESKAEGKYGREAAKKIAASIMWKIAGKKKK